MRQSNFELLRGVLMFMVVGLHVIGLGILSSNSPISFQETNFITGNLVESFFVVAVNCFILISGYWGIRASFKKLLALCIPVLFYSVMLHSTIEYFNSNFNLKSFLGYFVPQYWFVKSYILLFLLSPLLNKILVNIQKRELEFILLIGVFLFVMLPSSFSLIPNDRGFGIFNFSLLYMVGYYLRNFWNKNIHKSFYISIYVLSCLCIFMLNYLTAKYMNYNKGWMSRFYAYDTCLVYMGAISLFLCFKSFNIRKAIINKLSPSFFYIYIIHENPSVRNILYEKLDCPQYYNSSYWIFHTLFSCIVIFFGCLIIDVIRRLLFSTVENNLINILDIKYQKIKKLLKIKTL
jgi:surface polysaccharide O-acyltransferase-like enzyme